VCDAPPTPTEPVSLKVIDYVIDLFFVSDILLNLRTTYLRPDGKYETSIRAIRRHYLKGWFLIDCTASIALIVDICRDLGLISGGVVSSLISFLKACRLLRVAYLLKNFDHFASAGLVRVVIYLGCFLLVAHWVCCLWWSIGLWGTDGWQYQPGVVEILLGANFSSSTTTMSTLREQYSMMTTGDGALGKAYLTSVYWSLTILMKSPWLAPTSTGEQIYASIVLVFGTILFAIFIGLVSTTITSIERNNGVYRDQLSALRKFCHEKTLPSSTLKRLKTYWAKYYPAGRPDGAMLLQSLPRHVRPRLLVEIYAPLLDAASFLTECSWAGCTDFLECLQPEICLKGDSLLYAGTRSDVFYILLSGDLQVTFPQLDKCGSAMDDLSDAVRKRSGRVQQNRIDRPGALLGFQAPFLPAEPLMYTVRAYQQSEFVSIDRQALGEVLRANPQDAPVFMKAMQHAAKTLSKKPARESMSRRSAADANAGTLAKPSWNLMRRASELMDDPTARVSPGLERFSSRTEDSSGASYDLRRSSRPSSTHDAQIHEIEEMRQECSELGWLPRADSSAFGGPSESCISLAWTQQRETAEQDLCTKLSNFGDAVEQLRLETVELKQIVRTLLPSASPSASPAA